ncbi:MAG: hypothetical protein PHE17_18720 [Thiothrix sp.]|uniref:tetratricopeptide repeat protein n=1 Tax=Thiothrix sp. TaxID=1032 RepID=UPI00262875B8|nr:hypothetical protein [Thiothrix sp.]MDD5395058.1 hypothetical protein [Thiothrix sp.]
MMFWMVAACLVLLAVGLLCIPLLRTSPRPKGTLVMLILGLPLAAASLYLWLGNPAAITSPSNQELLAQADAILVADDDASGRAAQLIQQVLASEPQNPTALWLAGSQAALRGDKAKARSYWRSLLPLLQDSPQEQAEVQQLIKQSEPH